jgi:hypothetical protein
MFDRSLCFFLRWAGHQVIEEQQQKFKIKIKEKGEKLQPM